MGNCSCNAKKNIDCSKKGGCNLYNVCDKKLSVFDWLANIKEDISENNYIEVRFKNDRKDFFIRENNIPISIGDIIIVSSEIGYDVGVVSLMGELVKIQMKKKQTPIDNIKKILRKASSEEIDLWQSYRAKEEKAVIEARRIAKSLNLQMKICDVEYQGDGTKLTLYYTANGRVDFRQLIKSYASTFRAKVDMRQIGFRQESAKVGGIGSCGRELCCSTWLTDFRTVNTTVARYQQLSINPQKLTGQCGKLKCCLNFELDAYLDAISDFPPSHIKLKTEKGIAMCIKVDIFKRKIYYAYIDNPINWYPFDVDKLKSFININKKGEILKSLEELAPEKDNSGAISVDLIESNSLNRFDTKGKNKTNNPANKKGGKNNNYKKSTSNKDSNYTNNKTTNNDKK